MQAIDKLSMLDNTVRSLKEYIASDDVKVGDKMPSEIQLCNMLGIGRSTVREAIRVVQAMGYIEIRRGTGTFIISKESQNSRMNAVRWFKKEEIKILEMLEFRRYIEPYLVRLAAKRITKDELENLDEIMNRYAAADCQGDAVGLIVLDSKFHSAIAKATHNHVFISVFDELMIFLNEYFTHSTAVRIAENKLHEIPYQTHKKVYAALCQHDEVKAESEMRAHIDRTIDKMTNAAQDKDCE